MPASPAMRTSPRQGLREDNHKRGRSLESGIRTLEKDDDLALFNEVQNKERESFLLQQNDDLDDIFSTKLRYFSDNKHGISIPARGESSDLLSAEGDKNDYDWLITPPETPLFPSLDDDDFSATVAPRGRPRSQPISISRSSTMKGHWSARGSASPHRHSPSPQSGTSPLQPRIQPFSASHSSPPPTLRNPYPSRRLSPSPSKPTPAPASHTSTPRRMSTGSTGASAPSRARVTSPSKTSRATSTSPKINAWQSKIPGFNLEAPPNLRTSLADRPASYVRGSSPASRNSSRSGRQSMSPTATRSVSSSHSHEREQFSTYNRGSVVSSFDDEVDSLQSIPISCSDRSVPRSTSSFPKNKSTGFSKKPTKILSSSAPKRSFDLALRQMERKVPQNMFRPLLSSVPSSTFYVGKANAHQHPLTSRNSSITTSSNASSDQGTSAAIDTEESEQNQEDVTSDSVQGPFPTAHDDVFVMDQANAASETIENRIIEESSGFQHLETDGPYVVISQLSVADCRSIAPDMESDSLILIRKYESPDIDADPDVEVCSKCSHRFNASELVMKGDLWLCQDCKTVEANSTEIVPVKELLVEKHTTDDFVQLLEGGTLEDFNPSTSIPESSQVVCTAETVTNHVDNISDNNQHPYSWSIKDVAVPLIEEQQEIDHSVDAGSGHRQSQQFGNYLDLKVDISEGTGISLVLRSSSGRGRFVQSRSFTASNTSYEAFSYVRDSSNNMQSSIGRSSASMSSSVDLGSSRQTEMRSHRQLNSQKSDMENYRHEMVPKHNRSISSVSGASGHASQVPSVAPSYLDDAFEAIIANNFNEAGGMISADPHDQTLDYDCTEAESTCTDVENNVKIAAEPSSHLKDDQPGDSTMVSILTAEEPGSHKNEDGQELIQKEDATQSFCVNPVEVVGVHNPSSLDAISDMEMVNANIISADLQSDVDSPYSKCMSEILDPCVPAACDDVTTVVIDTDPANGILGEPTCTLEDIVGTKSRSFTLEEATDSILFCRSIIHTLAYEAANIAIDKESPLVEALRPALTLVNKSCPNRREVRSRKHNSKSQKARQRKPESDPKLSPVIDENNVKSTPPHLVVSPSKADASIPPKLESKCNCTIM